jgi:hypothetical protein
MTLLHLRHDDFGGFAREGQLSISRLVRRVGVAVRLLHRAIVTAKVRRLQSELLFRKDYSDLFAPEQDAAKFPQQPLILGDKWDF